MDSIRGSVLAILAVLIMAATQALAQTPTPKGPLWNTPVYNPDTKSYFEMKHFPVGYSNANPTTSDHARWEWAMRLARTFTHKGARGRLAVLRNAAALRFVERAFRPKVQVWIGLRYWCSVHRLQWVTHEFFDSGGAKIWAKPWGPAPNACSKAIPYFGVAIGGPDYQAHPWLPLLKAWGFHKEFPAFLVEYPTGKE